MRGVPDGGNVLEREPLLATLEATAQRVDSTGLAAAVLLCGEPGIGKSTLVLQWAATSAGTVLYASGEESERQIKLRAQRLGPKAPTSCSSRKRMCGGSWKWRKR